MLREPADDETVVVSERFWNPVRHITLERSMTDRERDDRLLASATDRFERRLSEEISGVRQEVSALRADMIEQDALIRLEIANLKVEMTEQFGAVRLGAETKHRELLKWALVFWVGQAASVAAIVSALN